MDDGDGDYGEPEEERCGPCMRGGGLLLLGLGGFLAWMGADLVTGGALTRLVTGGLAAGFGAASGALATWDDNEDEETGEPDDPASEEVTQDAHGQA